LPVRCYPRADTTGSKVHEATKEDKDRGDPAGSSGAHRAGLRVRAAHGDGHDHQFDPSSIGPDPEAYIARREAAVTDIRQGLQKEIV